MLSEKTNLTFSQYGKLISSTTLKKNAVIPFKDHPQFGWLVDCLSRKHIHHAILNVDMPQQLYITFIEAFMIHLENITIPYPLRDTECIYLDIGDREYYFEDAFQALRSKLDNTEKYLIIALSNIELLLRNQTLALITHPKCRLLAFTNHKAKLTKHEQEFVDLSIAPPSETDINAILKHQRNELEHFHHVIIPDELLLSGYTLAERYLSTHHALEKTLLLLDSAAARVSMMDPSDALTSLKPILTQITLLQVLSEWTYIPVSHLQFDKFNFKEFCQMMQQKIFGQENAVTLLGEAIQQSQARLREQIGPFCSALFTGPKASGKQSTALAYTEYLFKQTNMLFHAQHVLPSISSIWEIKFHHYLSKRLFTLEQIAQDLPHAVIYFEDIEKTPPSILEQLIEILSTGCSRHPHGDFHHFHHMSFILSTTLGSDRLIELATSIGSHEDIQTLDLMQLVSRHTSSSSVTMPLLSPQEMVDELMPELSSQLPTLCQYVHIVPFLPLNHSAVENIIRVRLKTLGKQLNAQYGIELGYAPEVIRYLAHEAMKQSTLGIKKSLEQLYIHVEQTVFNRHENKNHANQLFLQLNETGQVLRCEWLSLSSIKS